MPILHAMSIHTHYMSMSIHTHYIMSIHTHYTMPIHTITLCMHVCMCVCVPVRIPKMYHRKCCFTAKQDIIIGCLSCISNTLRAYVHMVRVCAYVQDLQMCGTDLHVRTYVRMWRVYLRGVHLVHTKPEINQLLNYSHTHTHTHTHTMIMRTNKSLREGLRSRTYLSLTILRLWRRGFSVCSYLNMYVRTHIYTLL